MKELEPHKSEDTQCLDILSENMNDSFSLGATNRLTVFYTNCVYLDSADTLPHPAGRGAWEGEGDNNPSFLPAHSESCPAAGTSYSTGLLLNLQVVKANSADT